MVGIDCRFEPNSQEPDLRTILATAALLAALSLAACGGDDETDRAAATPEAGTARTAAAPGLGAIKGYLLEHTEALSASLSLIHI